MSDLLAQAGELLVARDLEAAWAAYNRAESSGATPDLCAGGRWMVAMLRGDLEAAWRESDAIRARGSQDPHRFWTGEDFTGKRVILRCLHGFGDTVQWIRYAPLIAARARSLVVEVAPAMVELAGMFDGVDEVITWGADAPKTPAAWDVQMEINELPYIFRTRPEDLPLATGYLKLPNRLRSLVDTRARRSANLRIGVVWASGEWNPSRSVPLSLLERLFRIPGVEFWNLQGGAARKQWDSFPHAPHLHAAGECADSLVKLAEAIAQLDLVLTPDTLAAHLAGALGTPAWVMLEHAADWRWQVERDDSPWYPTLRLFRQPMPGNWETVVDTIHRELSQRAASNTQRLIA